MRIAICDDCIEYVNTIESYIDKIKIRDKDIDLDVYHSGEDLIDEYINDNAIYDAIFLDMEMSGINGIETANKLREFDKHVIIVFITSHTKYMQKSFECMPFRFLVKPIYFDDVQHVIDEIRVKLKESHPTFMFNYKRKYVRLFYDDIVYFESRSHIILVKTVGEEYQLMKPLNELINELQNDTFFRAHKSYIVNCKFVKEITEKHVILYGTDFTIPLSRTYKKGFIEGFINSYERKYMI